MVSIAQVSAFVGFDYHDSFVQVCVLDSSGKVLGNRRVANDATAILNFVEDARDGRMIMGAAIEACCGSSNLAEQLRGFEWDVQLAHAGICSKMKQSPDKTDFSDAHLLADLCRVGYLPRVWLPPKHVRDLRRLARYRQQLANQRRDVKLRIRAMLREERIEAPLEAGNVWTKTWLKWLAGVELGEQSRWVMDNHLEDLKRLETKLGDTKSRMEEATKDDPVVQKLLQTKGVGLVTAVVMRAEIGDFERFANGKQLARYCAVTPKNASSGNRQADAGLIKAGSLPLRTVLIEAAHRLTRFQPKWAAMKKDLVAAGKPSSVAAAAVANRWVRKLFWEMKEAGNGCLAA
jgi:transposase